MRLSEADKDRIRQNMLNSIRNTTLEQEKYEEELIAALTDAFSKGFAKAFADSRVAAFRKLDSEMFKIAQFIILNSAADASLFRENDYSFCVAFNALPLHRVFEWILEHGVRLTYGTAGILSKFVNVQVSTSYNTISYIISDIEQFFGVVLQTTSPGDLAFATLHIEQIRAAIGKCTEVQEAVRAENRKLKGIFRGVNTVNQLVKAIPASVHFFPDELKALYKEYQEGKAAMKGKKVETKKDEEFTSMTTTLNETLSINVLLNKTSG